MSNTPSLSSSNENCLELPPSWGGGKPHVQVDTLLSSFKEDSRRRKEGSEEASVVSAPVSGCGFL